jgi:hypothetical protein
LLLLPVLQGASLTPKTTAWNAMAEVFSDDFNLNIGDLLLNPLYHTTRKPRARLFMLMHVCARASSKLRASLTSAPIAASDLFSNPLSYISKVARQSGRAASAGGHHGGPRLAKRRPHPDSPAACITRYSDVTLGRLAGDTFACLLSRPLIAPRSS